MLGRLNWSNLPNTELWTVVGILLKQNRFFMLPLSLCKRNPFSQNLQIPVTYRTVFCINTFGFFWNIFLECCAIQQKFCVSYLVVAWITFVFLFKNYPLLPWKIKNSISVRLQFISKMKTNCDVSLDVWSIKSLWKKKLFQIQVLGTWMTFCIWMERCSGTIPDDASYRMNTPQKGTEQL